MIPRLLKRIGNIVFKIEVRMEVKEPSEKKTNHEETMESKADKDKMESMKEKNGTSMERTKD